MDLNHDPVIDLVECEINKLASGLIFLECSSKESVESFFQHICSLKKDLPNASPGMESIRQIIDIFEMAFKKASLSDGKRIHGVFTYIIAVLQNALIDVKQQGDLSGNVKKFENEISYVLNGQTPPAETRQLSDSQLKTLPEFISNAKLILEEVEHDLLELEKQNGNQEAIDRIFRHFHTIKGECGLLGLSYLSVLVHKVEDVLEKVRSHIIVFNGDVSTLLLDTVDVMDKHLLKLGNDFQAALVEKFSINIQAMDNILKQNVKPVVQTQDAPMGGQVSKDPIAPVEHKTEEFVPKIPKLNLSEGADIITEFITEAMDHLANAENAIMTLENNPKDHDAIDSIFRSFHTIKGLAGFLEFEDIRTLAHTSETMLDMVRNSVLSFEGIVADVTFEAVDSLRKLIKLVDEQIAHQGELKSPYFNAGPLISQLKEVIAGRTVSKPKIKKPVGEILIEQGEITGEELDRALTVQQNKDPHKKVGEILQDMHAASAKDVEHAVNVQKGITETSIKINVDKLDTLVDLVGEMVIVETQVVHNPIISRLDDRRLTKDLSELDRITRRLQEVAMGMRLVPVKPTFQKMLRIIRDLSKKLNKSIDVNLIGEETEIDKNMVELISDPLVHMVRNAADHGIESTEKRRAKGKPETGTINLAAYHKGGNVVVEIRDDGGGLDKERILQKATERGLVKAGETLPDSKIFNMIFEAGFSTAEKVTDVSGRGVGMDVVRRNIEKLRGKVDIASEKDKGSVFSIQLPITLAIIEGIVVVVGEQRYILPINSVIEFVQSSLRNLTNIAGKGEIFRVHEDVYPLIRLGEHFGIKSKHSHFEQSTVCLIESDLGRACLLVDELLGQQQVVIKNLGEKLKAIKGISGGAILGDGRVGLILDVNGIVNFSLKTMVVNKTESVHA